MKKEYIKNISTFIMFVTVGVSSSMVVREVSGGVGSRAGPLGTPWTMVEGGAT